MDLGKIIMYIIASTILVCTLMVLAFKGVNAMPFNWIGVVGAGVFLVAALAMTRITPPEH
jgi:hypothetical protein